MKNRTRVFLGLCVVLLLLLLSFGRQHPITESKVGPVSPAKTERVSRSPRPGAPAPDLEARLSSMDVPATDPLQGAVLWSKVFPEKAVRFAAVVNAANVPIHYYGLCIDEDNKPLVGVKVTMRIRQWQGITPIDLAGTLIRFEKASDAKGKFELSGVKADVATVESASLAGYRWIRTGSPSRDFTDRGESVPTAAAPVVLRFWKQHPAEAMYVATPPQRQHIACDKRSSTFDLKTGFKVVESAGPTVRFTMERDPVTINSLTKGRPSWELTVEIPGGGVQQTLTNMPFIAPAGGYASAITLGHGADDANWQPRTNATFYFRTSEGYYGRLEIDITAMTDGPVASLNWQSYLNPSGSQVLEYDPAKQIKVSPVQFPPTGGSRQHLTAPAFPNIPGPAAPGAPGIPQRVIPGTPSFPQVPPAFQALTNRPKTFGPPNHPQPPK